MRINLLKKEQSIYVIRCLFAIVAAIISTVSVNVFFYMRSFDGVEQYYSGQMGSIIRDAFSIRSFMAFFLLLAFYVYILYKIGRPHVSSMVISLPLAFNVVFSLSMEHSDLTEVFLPEKVAGNLLVIVGFALLLTACLELMGYFCDKKTSRQIELKRMNLEAQLVKWGIAFIVIMLCWTPFLYYCYPGSVMNDTRYQIMSWLGLKRMAAANPVLTTVLYGGLYQLGLSIGNEYIAIFLPLIVQTVIVASIMAGTAVSAYRYTRSKIWYWGTILFFSILPVWQNASQLLLKDVLHTGIYLLYYIQYLKCLQEKEKKTSSMVLLCVFALLVAFTRKATYYLALLSLIVLAIVHYKKKLISYLLCIASFVGIFVFSNQVLYPMLNIQEEWQSENYSLQFQQVALYCRVHQDEITYDEVEAINSVLDYDTIIRDYTPMISDPVKRTFHAQNQDMSAFWNVYFNMLKRDPLLFVKETVMATFEHMNPFFTGSNMRVYISHEENFIKTDFALPQMSGRIWKYFDASQRVPVLGVFIGTGLYTWILLAVLGYSIKKRSGMAFLGLFPSLTLFVGLFMSHVNGEIQYGYPLIAATPLIFAYVLYCTSKKGETVPAATEKATIIPVEADAYISIQTHEAQRPSDGLRDMQMETSENMLSTTEVSPQLLIKPAKTKAASTKAIQTDEADSPVIPQEAPQIAAQSVSHAETGRTVSEPMPAAHVWWKRRSCAEILELILNWVQKWIPVPGHPLVYLDVLKIIAIFLVLFNHTGSHGFFYFAQHKEMPWHMLSLLFSIFDKVAVPLFFMTAGALLIGREESYKKLFSHRVLRHTIILLVASLLNYIAYVKGDGLFDPLDFIRRLYTNNITYPLWYMYSYLSFLMMLPFIRKMAKEMKDMDYIWLLVSHLIMQLITVIDYLVFRGNNYHTQYIFFFTSYSYVVYSLCGFYIEKRLKADRLSVDGLLFLSMCSILALGLTYVLTEWKCNMLNDWSESGSQTFLSSFIVIPTLTLFYGMKLLFTNRPISGKPMRILSIMSSCTFGVYLFERTWRQAGNKVYSALAPGLGEFTASVIQILYACVIGLAATMAWKIITGIVTKRIKHAREE